MVSVDQIPPEIKYILGEASLHEVKARELRDKAQQLINEFMLSQKSLGEQKVKVVEKRA